MAIGELVVDWISTTRGAGFIEAESFIKSLGGNAANVAIGLSRLGSKSSLLAKVGDDVQGRYLLKVLTDEGVDVENIITDGHYPTAQCYVFTTADDDNTFLNWPSGNAAQKLNEAEITDRVLEGKDLIHATGISLTSDPRRSAVIKALTEAAERDIVISFDAGFPTGEGKEAKDSVKRAMSLADIIKVNLLELIYWNRQINPDKSFESIPQEITNLYDNPPSSGHEACAERALDQLPLSVIEELATSLFQRFKPSVLIVTLAERGSLLKTSTESRSIDVFRVETVAGVGAGDAYMAGFLHNILESCRETSLKDHLSNLKGAALANAGKFGSAVGALTTRSISAHASLPDRMEVEKLFEAAGSL